MKLAKFKILVFIWVLLASQASGAVSMDECSEIRGGYENEYGLCVQMASLDGHNVDCVECIVDNQDNANPWVDALSILAGPLALVGSTWLSSRYQHKTQKAWANAYMVGNQECTSRFNSFLNYSTERGANPILPQQAASMCNGAGMMAGRYAGFNGYGGNGFGGFGNPWQGAGYSPGFINGMMGPGFGPRGGFHISAGAHLGTGFPPTAGCACFAPPCPCNSGILPPVPPMYSPPVAAPLPSYFPPPMLTPAPYPGMGGRVGFGVNIGFGGRMGLGRSYDDFGYFPGSMAGVFTGPGTVYGDAGMGMGYPGPHIGGSYWGNTGGWQGNQFWQQQQQWMQAQQQRVDKYQADAQYARDMYQSNVATDRQASSNLYRNFVDSSRNYYQHGAGQAYGHFLGGAPYSPHGMGGHFSIGGYAGFGF